MEAIRISCAGYPTRKTFDEFVDRFGLLAPDALDGRCLSCSSPLSGMLNSNSADLFHFLIISCDEISACKRILENVGLEGYQVTVSMGSDLLFFGSLILVL